MRPFRFAPFATIAGTLLLVSGVSAQELDEICPGAEEGTGALWGAVTDADGDMALPGASVTVTWNDEEGVERRADVQTALDGGYTVCYLPLETELSVHAAIATMAGSPVALTMSEMFTRHDLAVALTATDSPTGVDDRIWLCIAGGESTINLRYSRLIRCDNNWQPLERCPKKELGQILAQPAGAGSGMMREMIEEVVQQAKRVGANAVINVRSTQSSQSITGVAGTVEGLAGEAVRIEVDPKSC